MPIDPAYDMPFPDYAQVGSFNARVSPPLLGPFDGTLVSLPCVNPDWLRILLGAVDQLRNPSSWFGLTPSQVVTVLGQVEDLRSALSLGGPCMLCPELRLQDCVLQISCDAGATWTDVSGWSAGFGSCVQLAGPGPVPPNPGGKTNPQRACDIAGYISQEIIKDVIQKAINAYNTSLTQLEFGLLIFDTIAFAFPITAIAVDVFAAFYVELTSLTIADFTSSVSDPALFSDLTCAIYSAIAATGYITAANLPNVIANVCAISYPHPSVISAICAFMTNIGLANLRAMQNVGALDVVDCTSCGTWCYEWDGSTGNTPAWSFLDHPYAPIVLGQYTPGVGFTPDPLQPNQVFMGIGLTPTYITDMEITTSRGSQNLGGASHIEIVGYATVGIDPPIGVHTLTFPVNTTVGHIRLNLASAAGFVLPQNITKVLIRGVGSNPFGSSNCF